jgi:hypothetical protein
VEIAKSFQFHHYSRRTVGSRPNGAKKVTHFVGKESQNKQEGTQVRRTAFQHVYGWVAEWMTASSPLLMMTAETWEDLERRDSINEFSFSAAANEGLGNVTKFLNKGILLLFQYRYTLNLLDRNLECRPTHNPIPKVTYSAHTHVNIDDAKALAHSMFFRLEIQAHTQFRSFPILQGVPLLVVLHPPDIRRS